MVLPTTILGYSRISEFSIVIPFSPRRVVIKDQDWDTNAPATFRSNLDRRRENVGVVFNDSCNHKESSLIRGKVDKVCLYVLYSRHDLLYYRGRFS